MVKFIVEYSKQLVLYNSCVEMQESDGVYSDTKVYEWVVLYTKQYYE